MCVGVKAGMGLKYVYDMLESLKLIFESFFKASVLRMMFLESYTSSLEAFTLFHSGFMMFLQNKIFCIYLMRHCSLIRIHRVHIVSLAVVQPDTLHVQSCLYCWQLSETVCSQIFEKCSNLGKRKWTRNLKGFSFSPR